MDGLYFPVTATALLQASPSRPSTAGQSCPSSSSTSTHTGGATVSVLATGSGGCEKSILEAFADGSRTEVWKLSRGNVVAQVVKIGVFGSQRILGEVKMMTDGKSGLQTLQAKCKIHSSKCICWISNSKHLDLLVDWVGKGAQESETEHLAMARALKQSIGMRVRG